MSLSYLFRATFLDGSTVEQTQADQSVRVAGKNSFYDVLERIAEVATFSLVSSAAGFLNRPKVVATVDLRTGLFALNGVTFQATDPSVIANLRDVPRFRLVYFKRHRHHYGPNMPSAHEIEYHLGWQATLEGKNHQQTIALR